jgi:hypothetical protein
MQFGSGSDASDVHSGGFRNEYDRTSTVFASVPWVFPQSFQAGFAIVL